MYIHVDRVKRKRKKKEYGRCLLSILLVIQLYLEGLRNKEAFILAQVTVKHGCRPP